MARICASSSALRARLHARPVVRKRAIIVRHFKAPRIDQFMRITVGTDAQCATLVQALHEILAG